MQKSATGKLYANLETEFVKRNQNWSEIWYLFDPLFVMNIDTFIDKKISNHCTEYKLMVKIIFLNSVKWKEDKKHQIQTKFKNWTEKFSIQLVSFSSKLTAENLKQKIEKNSVVKE